MIGRFKEWAASRTWPCVRIIRVVVNASHTTQAGRTQGKKTTSTNYTPTEEDLTLPIGMDDVRLAIPVPAKLVKPIKEGHNE